VDQSRFAAGFEREITHMAAMQPGKPVSSIFFGGGTPSLMEPETVERILSAIRGAWDVPEEIEITLEANPTSVEAGRFKAYHEAGVNRVSLGVQSLEDEQLKFLGRLHSAKEARAAIEIARDIFPRLSFDLIYARPGQTNQEWQKELQQAIDLAADHLSLYQLTIEQGTPFYDLHKRRKFRVPNVEQAAQLYELTQEITANAGLPAYEISNHAKPDHECRHNLTYWRFGTWAGIGPGAHGRLIMNDGRHATTAERYPEKWLELVDKNNHGMVEDEVLTSEETADEMLLMGLRLREGLDIRRYERLSETTIDPDRLTDMIEHGMVEELEGNRLRATSAGWLVLDAVIADLAS